MEKPYKVLFVDDDIRYASPLVDSAFKHNLELIYFENWEEAISNLDDNFSDYQAVIIDGKGKKTKDSQGDDPSHVRRAIEDLSERKGQGNYIPYVILSKYLEIREYMEMELFFEKGIDEEKMFHFLIKSIEESEVIKIKTKYSKAFRPFDLNILNIKYVHMLMEMLKCIENQDYKKKNLNTIRDLLEAIFLTLADSFNCIPDSFINQNGKPTLEWCVLFFAGKEVKDGYNDYYKIPFTIPGYIHRILRYIKDISSEFSHFNENEIVKNPFISASYAMLEILEWLPHFIEENYE